MATSTLNTTTGVTYITGSVGSFTSSGSISGTELLINGPGGTANSVDAIVKTVTGIGDNSATDILTITIPNANHAAALRMLFLSSNGGADAYESNRVGQGLVVFQRNTGAVAVATAGAIVTTAIATNAVGGSATHTLAYAVSAVTGAAGASMPTTRISNRRNRHV